MTPLTEIAHQRIAARLHSGDLAFDLTAGNGWDSLFLAQCVGSAGRVYALDIQQQAIDQTSRLLATHEINWCELHCRSHAELLEFCQEKQLSTAQAIMMNLGYLPGGSHALVTRPESTLAAVQFAVELLSAGGVMTILAYPRHEGGAEELQLVQQTLSELNSEQFEIETMAGSTAKSPVLFVVLKNE